MDNTKSMEEAIDAVIADMLALSSEELLAEIGSHADGDIAQALAYAWADYE